MHVPPSKIKTKTTSVNPIYWSMLFLRMLCLISYIFTIILFLHTHSFLFYYY
jgi:hypothetical protein